MEINDLPDYSNLPTELQQKLYNALEEFILTNLRLSGLFAQAGQPDRSEFFSQLAQSYQPHFQALASLVIISP